MRKLETGSDLKTGSDTVATPSTLETGTAVTHRRLLFVLSGNMLLDALEVSMMLIALPSIAIQFRLSAFTAHWLQSGFAVGFGCLVLYGARLGALLGRRRIYLHALQIFALASLIAAAAPVAMVLVVARVVKGGCAALTAPIGLAIIAATFTDEAQRRNALKTYALCGAVGFSIGTLLSGLLTEIGWRYVLLLPALAALALSWLGTKVIPVDASDSPPLPWRRLVSLPICLAASLILVGAVGARSNARWLLAIAGMLGLLVVAMVLERRSARAMTLLLSRPSYLRSVLGAALLNGSYWSLAFVLSMDLQQRGRWPAIGVAGLVLMSSVALFGITLRTPALINRFGTGRLIAVGSLVTLIGYSTYLTPAASRLDLPALSVAMLLVGIGFGLSFGSLHVQAMHGAQHSDRGTASGVYQAAVQLGGAVLLATTAALFNGTAAMSAYQDDAMRFVVACAGVGLIVAVTGLKPTKDL